jgi:hypothetical protein
MVLTLSAFDGPGRRVRLAAFCVVLTLMASACKDASGHPLALAVAPETHGAVVLGEEPATLPRVLTDHGLARAGVLEIEAWRDSWSLGGREGEALREQVHPMAARRLVPVLGKAGVQDLLARTALTLASVHAIGSSFESEFVATSLARARELQRGAALAAERDDPESALVGIFRVSDVLWNLSPGRVAQDLLEKARLALERKPDPSPYSEEELIRIRRLMFGATEALEAQDFPGAIRRAYYACQLLGATPP